MGRFEIDPAAAERLLAGMSPADAPPGLEGVARLLAAARAEPSAAELAREEETVAAMAAAVAASPAAGRPIRTTAARPRMLLRLKVGSALVAGTMALGTGLAAAGALPDPVQRIAATVLGTLGISVPSPTAHATGSASPSALPTDNHGAEVSDVARTTTATGSDHGAAVCAVASEDRCKAGEVHPSGPPSPHPSPPPHPSPSPNPKPSHPAGGPGTGAEHGQGDGNGPPSEPPGHGDHP